MSFPSSTALMDSNQVRYLDFSRIPNTILELKKFASQGATFGAAYVFVTTVTHLLLHPDAYLYNYLALYGLPQSLGAALLPGLCAGLAMWGCWRLSRRLFGQVARPLIGIVLFGACCYGLDFVWTTKSTGVLDCLSVSSTLFFGTLFGLFTGSSLDPMRELFRGTDRRSLLAITSGALLRILVVFLLMESILLLTALRGLTYTGRDLVLILFSFGHLAVGAFIVFSRLNLVLLTLLSAIVNLPVASMLLIFPHSPRILNGFIFGYLILWAVFLLSRCRPKLITTDGLGALS